MGIMQNKVSRRMALGAIAGGLVGAAVVVRAMKSRRPTLPDGGGKYVADWERNLKLVDVPIKDIDGPSTFVLDYRPQVGARFQATCLGASYENENYPKPPSFHSMAKGQLTVSSPAKGDRSAFLIVGQDDEVFNAMGNDKKSVGKCLVVPTIVEGLFDGFSYFGVDDTSKELLPAKVNASCRTLADTVMFNYPPGQTLAKGTKWTVPESLSHSVELPCEVVGFAMISGRKTVKILAEQHLDNEQYQRYVVRSWQDVTKLGFAPPSDSEIQKDLRRAVDRKLSLNIRVAYFLDLSSGICVHNEAVMNVHGQSYDHTIVQISQVSSV
jgi:hypothetical protein